MNIQRTSARKLYRSPAPILRARRPICHPDPYMPQRICRLMWPPARNDSVPRRIEVLSWPEYIFGAYLVTIFRSSLGKALIAEMNRLGVLVDLSHTSDATARQSLAYSKAPVIWSHSSARAVHNVPRNVPDNILRLIGTGEGQTDAVVMVSHAACAYTAHATLTQIRSTSRHSSSQFLGMPPCCPSRTMSTT